MSLGEYTVASQVRIERPIQDVWAFVSDPENDPTWCRLVSDVSPTEGGPGRTYRYVQRFGPMKRDGTVEIVSEDRPRGMGMRTRVMGAEFVGAYTLEADGASTVFTHTNEVRWSGPMRVMSPLQRRVTKRIMDRQLGRLKILLEETLGR